MFQIVLIDEWDDWQEYGELCLRPTTVVQPWLFEVAHFGGDIAHQPDPRGPHRASQFVVHFG